MVLFANVYASDEPCPALRIRNLLEHESLFERKRRSGLFTRKPDTYSSLRSSANSLVVTGRA